jgi:hypothetical protein
LAPDYVALRYKVTITYDSLRNVLRLA